MIPPHQVETVVISIGDQQITSKNCFVESVQIDYPPIEQVGFVGSRETKLMEMGGPIRIRLELVTNNIEEFKFGMDGKSVNYISTRKVKDCNIQELLYAIRKKITEGKKKK